VDKLIEQQSIGPTRPGASSLSGRSKRKLAEDGARADHLLFPAAATCWQPHVKGLTIMVNSIFNGNRREDIWLDK